ncbi:hypothetical protein ALC53_09653 [Atta colombica]|uniref:Uncharacterized protein n=1 Tax=Atta colombica TaxID=520822 RepID=A0A151I185_9HYME|nr:hypothetical protein ALC53_09653 [Atta colombica]
MSLKLGCARRMSSAPRKNAASRIQQNEHLHHIARESISALRHRTRAAAASPRLHLFWSEHTFRFRLVRPGFEGLQDAPAPPSRSHLSRRIIGVPWSPGMGCRWYCHMADTGAGLRRPASKTAIAHPHKSMTDSARVSLPSNYLIDVTRAVSRAMSFFYAEGVKHACTDSKRHNSLLSREQTVGTVAIVHAAQANVVESGLTDVLESPPDHGEMPTWSGNKLAWHNKLKRGMYPRRRGRIVVGFLFTCTRCPLQQKLGRVLSNSVDASKL